VNSPAGDKPGRWEEIVTNTRQKLSTLAADLNHQVRSGGWRQAGRWLVETIVSLPYCRIEYIVFARSLLDPLPAVEPGQPVTIRQAGEADLDRLEGLVLPSELSYFRRRLAHGRLCFLAFDGEKLAAYCWATTQIELDVDVVPIPLRPGDAYLNDAYTIPTYRRRGIQMAVHLYRLAHMKSLGCRRAILIVEEDNVASQRLVRKLGYQDVDRLSFRRVLWKRTYRSGQCLGHRFGQNLPQSGDPLAPGAA
jgi:ribosomal protein S18 acetylase RimI-like enzyme